MKGIIKTLIITTLLVVGGSVFAATTGDNIIISELEYDAIAPDQAGEWFELYNPTSKEIYLTGWSFTDGEGTVTFPNQKKIYIKSNSYFIATHTATNGSLTNYPSVSVDLEYGNLDVGSLSFANSGDEFSISNAGGNLVDAVSWGGGARFNISADEGETIARNNSIDTDVEDDWLGDQVSSPGSGSLTLINQAPLDISINGGDSYSVDENTPSGTIISTITTTDLDSSDTHTYMLVAGVGDKDNLNFTVNGTDLELAFIPDYETPVDLGDTAANNTYSIRLETNDGTDTYEKVFIISIVDIVESESSSSKKGGSRIKYTCKDESSTNYNKFGRHRQSLCEYATSQVVIAIPEITMVTPPNEVTCTINYTRLIKQGSVGEDVRQVQICMNSLGHTTGETDGIYGPNTYAGITKYQTSAGLKYIDGVVGPETSTALNALSN